ncbi:hypothetical protein CPC08DRAFT_770706 [Agrocybe pediades]|nr:hypothetical protein CPC08DRAFT_770706 [Agrocybe pediades]
MNITAREARLKGLSILELAEDPLKALYIHFNVAPTETPSTLADLGSTFDMRVTVEDDMPTHLLAVYQADNFGMDMGRGSKKADTLRTITMLPIDRTKFEQGFKLDLDQPDDEDEEEEEEEGQEEEGEGEEEVGEDNGEATSEEKDEAEEIFGNGEEEEEQNEADADPSKKNPTSYPVPRPHAVFSGKGTTLYVSLPVIRLQVPHVRSLPLLLLYGMGLETNTNILAYALLPVQVVEEFPNSAEMAMILARHRESMFDGIYKHNFGMWRNALKLGVVDTELMKILHTAWNISAEAKKLRRAGAHIGPGIGYY